VYNNIVVLNSNRAVLTPFGALGHAALSRPPLETPKASKGMEMGWHPLSCRLGGGVQKRFWYSLTGTGTVAKLPHFFARQTTSWFCRL